VASREHLPGGSLPPVCSPVILILLCPLAAPARSSGCPSGIRWRLRVQPVWASFLIFRRGQPPAFEPFLPLVANECPAAWNKDALCPLHRERHIRRSSTSHLISPAQPPAKSCRYFSCQGAALLFHSRRLHRR